MKFAMITFAAAVGSANAGLIVEEPVLPTLVAAQFAAPGDASRATLHQERQFAAPVDARMATAFAAPGDARMATAFAAAPGDARMVTSVFRDVPTNSVQKLRTNSVQKLRTDQIHGRISSLKNTNTMIREDARIEEDEHRIPVEEHRIDLRSMDTPRREDARIEEFEHRIPVEEHRIDLRSMNTPRPLVQDTLRRIQDGCDAESECMDEWRNQRWGDATHEKMCGGDPYHIDCRACSFCAREEEDVRPNFDGTNGNMHGIFDSSMFVDGCNPKTCPEWDCRKWCHCYDTNPNVELMFESVQYGGTLARICPEDDTACNCDLE